MMPDKCRGADLLVEAFRTAGTKKLFTLSGNQIMSVFDACIDTGIEMIHVRHEAPAVHMADAWGRLTGQPGIAMVTAGPGMANCLSALYVALMAESPMILLSGHAPKSKLGQGAFQEMAQAEMASHVTKASWTASDPEQLGHDLARAYQIASQGRPGPVHVSLPGDLLEEAIDRPSAAGPPPEAFRPSIVPLDTDVAEQTLAALAEAKRPLILAGPAMVCGAGRSLLADLAEATRLPVIGMESPRGVNDPSLGAFAEVLREADLIVLVGKKLDFTLRFGAPPDVSASCRWIHLDPEAEALSQTGRLIGDTERLILTGQADSAAALRLLTELAGQRQWPTSGWRDEVDAAINYRPAHWATINSDKGNSDKGNSDRGGPLHAAEVCRGVQAFLAADDNGVFISDGGEFGQWAQACVSAPNRIINGPAGSIGSALPFAIAARTVFPDSRIVTMLGDGTFGFHPSEFDTAVRYHLPFIAVVGNDAMWNAEYQIQLRSYGPERAVGCDLLPSRYDEVARVLGGHGEHVLTAGDLAASLEQAHQSGLPACVNVSVQHVAAPLIRRDGHQE